MERRHKGRLKHQEDLLAAHVEELKADLSSCKDARVAAKLARSVISSFQAKLRITRCREAIAPQLSG